MKKVFSLLGGLAIIALTAGSFTFAFTQEQIESYQRAYKYGLTTQSTIEQARMNSPLTRQAFAKMVVKYLENVVGIKQSVYKSCSFPDEDRITNDLKPYAKRTCTYQIMGSDGKKFNPTQLVDRAQVGTVFSRILWGDKHDVGGRGYYIYHVNALEDVGIMNNIKNVQGVTAKRGDVLIMFKRMYDKFGSNIYLNSGNKATANQSVMPENTIKTETVTRTENVVKTGNTNQTSGYIEDSENDYISAVYSNSNVIYTGKDGTKYYYDDKFLSMLKDVAKKKGESDLAEYLEIESAYFKSGLDQLSDLDDEELLKLMGIDINEIDPENMTNKEKQELIKKFKSAFGKIIDENKTRNEKLVKDLAKVTKNIKNDKFGLSEKQEKTKAFMETSDAFLDLYSESLFSLMEIALNEDENGENSEEGMAQAFGIIGAALMYQSAAQEYQTYVEEWAVNTISLLGID